MYSGYRDAGVLLAEDGKWLRRRRWTPVTPRKDFYKAKPGYAGVFYSSVCYPRASRTRLKRWSPAPIR